MIRKKLIEPPEEFPIDLDELKGKLRLDKTVTAEDPELSAWMASGLEEVENRTHRRLVTQTWELSCDNWYEAREEMPLGICQKITSLIYKDSDGTEQVVSPGDYELIDAEADYARIFLLDTFLFPETSEVPGAIRIQFICGYGGPKDVPELLKDAIALYVMDMRNDDDVERPLESIVDQYRYHA